MPVFVESDGDWDAFEQEVAAFARLEGATVGTLVPEEPHPGPRASKSGLTYRDLVEINEFGTDATKVPIPARPIFTTAMRDNEDGYVATLDAAMRQYRSRNGSIASLRVAMNALGREMVQDVHVAQQRQDFPDLAESTVARKGHDVAWEEQMHLLKALGYAVAIDERPTSRMRNGQAAFRNIAGRFAKVGK